MKRLWLLPVIVVVFITINPSKIQRLAERGEGGAIIGQLLVPLSILILYLITSAGWSWWKRRKST